MNLAISYYDLPNGEREVAELYACGLTKKEIAIARNRSIHTIGNQLKQIFIKTGTRKDTELAAWYFTTRYHLSLNIPDIARRFIALSLLALVGFSVMSEQSIVRAQRTARTQRTVKARTGKRTEKTYSLC